MVREHDYVAVCAARNMILAMARMLEDGREWSTAYLNESEGGSGDAEMDLLFGMARALDEVIGFLGFHEEEEEPF